MVQTVQTKSQLSFYILYLHLSSFNLFKKERFVWTVWTTPIFVGSNASFVWTAAWTNSGPVWTTLPPAAAAGGVDEDKQGR